MEKITDVRLSSGLDNSIYVKPFRVFYTQNGVKKRWDLVESHDSVAILIHNTTRDVFVFVRQFRPAVYISLARSILGPGMTQVDTSRIPPADGCTLELCAGIVDKNIGTPAIACAEIEEECGYRVPVESLQLINVCRNNVGLLGSTNSLYYVQVTDSMKVSAGGGSPTEGELIEVVEVPVSESMKLIRDVSVPKPIGMLFALLWFHTLRASSAH